jgi:hypothetical protein
MLDPQVRGQAYVSLGWMLQRPNEELLGLVSGSDFRALWAQVEASFNIQFPKSWEAGSLPDLKEWEKMWDITMGPVNPLAEPIESLYKVWTTDESCEMSFANEKGYLRGDWACHMEELLTNPGFEIPPQFAHCPDHLILEFEFFSILVEQAPVEAQLKFAEQHLNWLEDLFETAKSKNVPQMYQDLYNLCAQFAAADKKLLV